ncbi:MAG: RNA pyrophosphohydrolase [Hyphomicrobiaceae bacterium]|nr:RNA pyrophosphohydrolase [Hyphomicrobiaceae bacterium]
MLTDGKGGVFVGSRIDREAGEAWQMPQGGIDKGEDLEEAARRELFEETGIRSIEIIAESKDWLNYDLPPELLGKALKGKYRGQTQKWFLARFTGKESEIRLDLHEPEFEAWRWAPVDDLPKLIVPFKKALYEALVAEFGSRVKALAKP